MKHYLKILLPLLLSSCGSAHKPIPNFDGKVYAFDTQQRAFVRGQSHEVIPDMTPEAGEMISMHEKDFERFLETYILRCDSWDHNLTTLVPTDEELKKVIPTQ